MSSDITIQLFALDMQISVEQLIQEFSNIGIKKTKFDFITQVEKERLFKHVRHHNIISIHQFSLRRQTRSILNILNANGKNKQVEVEVRKKQTYVIPRNINPEELNSTSLYLNNTTLQYNKKSNVDKESNVDNESINSKLDNILIQTNIKNNKNDILHDKRLVTKMGIMNVIDSNDQLHIKPHLKGNEKSKKIINKQQQIHKSKNMHSHHSSKDLIDYFNKNDKNQNFSKLDRSYISESNNNNAYKVHSDKNSANRTRIKYKSVGKLFKPKKINFHCLYDSINNENNTTEKLYSSYRVNKNKRKYNNSTLIQGFKKPTQVVSRNIVIGETVSVLELSNKMSVKSSYMIKFMMKLGFMVTINQMIDQETAQLIIEEMGHIAILRRENELEELVMNNDNNHVNNFSITNKNNNSIVYKNRAPIVAVMGHVDHGKTSILDYIRSTSISSDEEGGITQGIRAYRFTSRDGTLITFVDTPGHAAFTNMRVRGAQLTDIAVLVVAADDGVMPQTVESIQHIKSTKIPVIVAINKIDKTNTNVDRIQNELNNYGFIPEEWGGHTQFIKVSAISGIGINDLLDAIILQSEMLELKTVYNGIAKAVVIESFINKGRGLVIIVLIKEGELKCGDFILCGTEYGRVRAMRDEYGNNINVAYPSMPVEILGLSGTPNPGDIMVVVQNEKKAREVAIYRKDKYRVTKLSRKKEESNVENVFDSIHNTTDIIELNIIVKSDTQGSMEAICNALQKLSNSAVIIKILFASIGNITETDVVLASTSKAYIFGFNVKPDLTASRIIASDNLDVRCYSIIYDLLNSVKSIVAGCGSKISNSSTFDIIGSAEVHNIFKSTTYGVIAGCIVIEGLIRLKRKILVFRNNSIIYKGELESLRHFKNNINEVKSGMECGIVIKNFNDIKCGDIIKVLNIDN